MGDPQNGWLFAGKNDLEMDDNLGYPHDSGHLTIY